MRHNDFKRSARQRRNSRKGSSTSLDSHFGANLLNALTTDNKTAVPNLKRRTGNAGLDGLLSNGKLVIPSVRSASEDENVSVTISESRYNVVLNNLDLNDQLVMKSLRQGLHIDSSTDSENVKDYEQEKRESRNSRRSKRSRKSRVKYSSPESLSESSSCPELKQLVQSSLNSGVSGGACDKSRGSKQSKVSIDVACQTNSCDILPGYETQERKEEGGKCKSKRLKTKENRRYKQKDAVNGAEATPLKDCNH